MTSLIFQPIGWAFLGWQHHNSWMCTGLLWCNMCSEYYKVNQMSPIATWISYNITYLRNIPVPELHNAPCHSTTAPTAGSRRTEQWRPEMTAPRRKWRTRFRSSLRLVAAHRSRDLWGTTESKSFRLIRQHENPTRTSPMMSFRLGGVCAGLYLKHVQGGASLADIIIIWHDNETRM